MSKYATGRNPDMTNNFFLMQDLDITIPHEISELVWAVCYNEALHTRIMHRVINAAYVMGQLTDGFDGVTGGPVQYNWLPVRFYMALATESGARDEYDGFKITITCPGVRGGVEIFFSLQAAAYKNGVFDRHQLGGWSSRISSEDKVKDVDLKEGTDVDFIVTLRMSEYPKNIERVENSIMEAINHYREAEGLTDEEDPATTQEIVAVKLMQTGDK